MQIANRVLRGLLAAGVLGLCAGAAAAQTANITTPKEQFGFNLGDDYQLTNYTQLSEYWHKLASQSDRMKLTEIGKTAEGRPQYMAIVTSPENLKMLDHYKEISRKLALAEGLSDEEAHALASEGKAVVWIDGGLHASEVECAQALTEMIYQMVSRKDPETMRLLNDVIILFVQDNPDGQELVANWYMRNPEPTKRTDAGLPRLWHKYIGHDNNRDFFMCNMPESTNINRVLYLEWFPQIMYNHHQTGPPGAVIFMPPFRDPFNYHFDPLIMMELDQVGSAMHSRMEAEDKPGAGMRSAATYSTWYNGGLRTTTYFHNIIGLLTEIIGNPTPIDIPLVPAIQLPKRRFAVPDRAAEVAFAAVDRVFVDGESGCAGFRVAVSRDAALQHLSDGQEFDPAGERGCLDDHADIALKRWRRKQRKRRVRRMPQCLPRRPALEGRVLFRRSCTGRCCTIRRCAIRAGTSFRPISRICRRLSNF